MPWYSWVLMAFGGSMILCGLWVFIVVVWGGSADSPEKRDQDWAEWQRQQRREREE